MDLKEYDKIAQYFINNDIKIVPLVYKVDDTKLDRCFQYVRDVNGVEFDFEDFTKEMDKTFLREKATFVNFDYKKIANPYGMGTRHFIRMNFNDGRDEITRRNDAFYDKVKHSISNLLYDENYNEKFVYKKDLIKLLKELE